MQIILQKSHVLLHICKKSSTFAVGNASTITTNMEIGFGA